MHARGTVIAVWRGYYTSLMLTSFASFSFLLFDSSFFALRSKFLSLEGGLNEVLYEIMEQCSLIHPDLIYALFLGGLKLTIQPEGGNCNDCAEINS